jgi:hypothetical protein
MTLHVRWPARRAELRAGLDFSFVSFLCIKTKKRKNLKNILYCFEKRRNVTEN